MSRNTALPPRLDFDVWLTFRDPDKEADFQKSCAPIWTHWDFTIFCTAVPAGFSKILNSQSWASLFHKLVYHMWYTWVKLVVPLAFLGFILWKRDTYYTKRQWWITCGRIMLCVGAGMVFFVHEPEKMWQPSVLASRLFAHTPIAALLVSSFNRLPFRQHVWVHFLCAIISWVWIFNLCEGCERNPDTDNMVNYIGWLTEGAIIRISTFGFPTDRPALRPGQYSCWQVGLFYHIWLGLFLPTAGVYMSELLSRVEYIKRANSISSSEILDQLNTLKISKLIYAGLVTVVGTQFIWVLLKAIDNSYLHCPAGQLG